MWALCRVWSATSIAPPHPGLRQVICSCCSTLTNLPCAIRSCSDFISPPSCPLPHSSTEGGLQCPLLPASTAPHPSKCSLQARSSFLLGWGLIDLPLRASNEGSPRPRVARAQEIIRLHPFTLPTPR